MVDNNMSKGRLIELLQDDGYHLPAANCGLADSEWLLKVAIGRAWCPKDTEVVVRTVVQKPGR